MAGWIGGLGLATQGRCGCEVGCGWWRMVAGGEGKARVRMGMENMEKEGV